MLMPHKQQITISNILRNRLHHIRCGNFEHICVYIVLTNESQTQLNYVYYIHVDVLYIMY